MPQTWRPTGAAKLFTSAKDWSLTLDGDRVSLVIDGRQFSESVLFLDGLHAKLGLLWATVQIPAGQGKTIDLEGMPNKAALELVEAVTTAVAGIRHRHKVAELLREFSTRISPVVAWSAKARQSCKVQLKTQGWLTAEFRATLQRGEHEELWGLSLRGYSDPTKRIPPPSFSAGRGVPLHNSSCPRERPHRQRASGPSVSASSAPSHRSSRPESRIDRGTMPAVTTPA